MLGDSRDVFAGYRRGSCSQERPSSKRVFPAGNTRMICKVLVLVLSCSTLHIRRTYAQQTVPVEPKDQQLSGRGDSALDSQPFNSVVFPAALPPLLPQTRVRDWLHKNRIRMYGWLDGGYTYASTGDGLLTDAPSPNRFGNEFVLNGVWLIVDRQTAKKGWSWGFRSDFHAGSDAALLRPLNSFGPQGTHMGTDFRQAYLSLHTPGVNDRGIDWSFGRQNVPIGYETLMGPYGPGYGGRGQRAHEPADLKGARHQTKRCFK